MIGPATGEPGRGRGAPSRAEGWDAASSVLILLGLGLAFRLIIAYLLPGSGFKVDLNAFQYWASNLASQGLHGFYERPFFHDYTPGYLYVLWLVGVVGSLFGGSGGVGDLIKIPPILADLGLAWLVWSMARELGAGRRAALLGAALVIVNPISWFDSVVWGQVDSFGVLFLLLGLRELWRDRPERSALFTMIAAITKPQLGILIPIVAAVTIRRALRPKGAYGADAPPERSGTTTRWEAETRGWIRIVTTGLVGFLTAVVVSLPFGLSIPGLLEQVFKTAGGYPYLSVNAYNPWALITHGGRGIAATSSWVCDSFVQPTSDFDLRLGPLVLWHAPASTLSCTDPVYFGALPAVAVGALLLLAAIAAVVALVAWRPDRRTMLVGLALLCLAFFVLPTRVHERYLYPLVALGAILAAVSWRWRIAYVVSSVATIANMYAVLTTLYPDNPNISDWLGIGRTLISWPGVAAAAVAQLAVFAWAATQLRPAALRRLGEEIEDSAIDVEGQPPALDEGRWARDTGASDRGSVPQPARAAETSVMATRPGPRAVASDAGVLADGAAGVAAGDIRRSRAALTTSERPRPRWDPRPSFGEVGARGWLAARLWDRPTRADRTAELEREPGGRFDRLDLWIVVVLVASLLTLRMWRLGEPYQMHFDEVYHPRTATEFLQDWRYGISHYIYEWTHPHLAKYAMALGIEAFGDDRTSATSDLGVPVAGAAIEPRWEDATDPGAHLGDRLWVATGDQVRAYDLTTRSLVASADVAGATAVAVDTGLHRVLIGTATGELRIADTRPLDDARGATAAGLETQAYARLDGRIQRLFMPRDASVLEAVIPGTVGDTVVTFDPATAAEIGRSTLGSVNQMSDAGTGRIAVATPDGLAFIDTQTGSISSTLALGGPVMGVAQTRDLGDDRLYASFVGNDGPRVSTVVNVDGKATDPPKVGETFTLPGDTAGWVAYDWATMMIHVLGSTGPTRAATQADTAPPSPTIYVVEPHANAVYEDARLPFAPTTLVIDDDQRYPSTDRQQILAFTADGAVASVETGQNAFAWRLPGVIAGVLMAALLYLLGRLLFRRREVALFLAFLSVVDGMLFVQSRIGMNDSYVGLAIVAAYTLFAAIWLRPGGTRRHWIAFAVAMPIIGLLLGLGLASKWVAAYAMGALGILVLARSALGRALLLAGLVVGTTLLGYMAVSTPNNAPGGNYLFLSIMIAITLAAAVANVLHPVAWTWEERRLATYAPGAIGIAVALAALALGKVGSAVAVGPVKLSPIELGFAGVVASGAMHALFLVVGRWGFGPLAAPPAPGDPAALLDPAQPAPRGWLNLGSGFGIPAAWMLLCLVVLPVVVYVISYVPWAQVESHRLWPAGSLAGFTWTAWPQGHTGQTLWELTQEMYRYHNTLSSPHAASSPWWAWPFDFKPVWFYQESFAGGTAAAIYDSGNLVAWWLGIPAMAFVTWAAFKRRSAALALVVVGFACQWLAWSRIDRAAFQYHYYTSLPFLFLGLAYFLAELWHGASRRLWLVARLAAGAAVLAPTTLWLFHRPLCGFVRVTDVNPGSRACPTVIPDFVLTARAAGIAVVLGIGLLIVVTLLLSVDDEDGSRGPLVRLGGRLGSLVAPLGRFAPAVVAAAGVSVAFIVASRYFEEVPLIQATNVVVEPVALLVTLALLPLAAFVATARDARRFVVGALFAMAFWFVLWYPNLAALPLPGPLSNAYQGLLPTYVYPFQFPVSTLDRNVAGPPLISFYSMALFAALAVVTVVVGYSTWVARVADAERRAEGARLPAESGDPGGAPA